ncbi:MAG: hypothetical protein WCJ35_25330 [Planctomycetota bacterium]
MLEIPTITFNGDRDARADFYLQLIFLGLAVCWGSLRRPITITDVPRPEPEEPMVWKSAGEV